MTGYTMEQQAQDALREMEHQAGQDWCEVHGWCSHDPSECEEEG